jgi:hypothetical protein
MSEDEAPHEQRPPSRLTASPATTPRGQHDPLAALGPAWAAELSGVAQCLRVLGLAPASEEAYTRVINTCAWARACARGVRACA